MLRGVELPYPLPGAESAIIGRFGDRPGARAVFLAADQGYTVQQIVAAGVEGRLSEDGRISGTTGDEVPNGKASGRFSRAMTADVRYASLAPPMGQPPPLARFDFLDSVLDALANPSLPVIVLFGDSPAPGSTPTIGELRLTRDILGLLAAGYDVETIVEAIFFQPTLLRGNAGVYIVDEKKGFLCPPDMRHCPKKEVDAYVQRQRSGGDLSLRDCISTALSEADVKKSRPPTREVIANEITVCRTGNDFQVTLVLKTLGDIPITGGGACPWTIDTVYTLAGTVPRERQPRWVSTGRYETRHEVVGNCSRLSDSSGDVQFTIFIEGDSMTGHFQGAPWKIEDARVLLGK
jgi:hypothetical protein